MDIDGKSKDPVAGVVILLSKRMTEKVIGLGTSCLKDCMGKVSRPHMSDILCGRLYSA